MLVRTRIQSYLFFFFSSRRRHTRFDCDWSSDVCSSDLLRRSPASKPASMCRSKYRSLTAGLRRRRLPIFSSRQIGRASWRGRVEISGGGGSLKKKKKEKMKVIKRNQSTLKCACDRDEI